MDKRGEYYTNRHGNKHEISFAAQQTTAWSTIVLGVLVALNVYFTWGSGLQYLWAVLIVLAGIWMAAAN